MPILDFNSSVKFVHIYILYHVFLFLNYIRQELQQIVLNIFYSPWMVDNKQNKSYNVQLNYNLTKRTQHTQISAMTAYKIASVAIVTTLSDATTLEIEFRI